MFNIMASQYKKKMYTFLELCKISHYTLYLGIINDAWIIPIDINIYIYIIKQW